ncbi:MAG: hypothetical protein V4552_10385 [Pseudomonadota bacterium]
MFKKVMMFVLLNVFLAMPVAVLAGVGDAAQIRSAAKVANAVKIADAMPVIRLTSNDIVQMQETGARNTINKNAVSEQSATELSKVPSQVWLILTALFCFVMRSSRRVV